MLQAGSGFLSQHSKDVFFGLGDTKGPVNASIRWPSGLVQQLHDLPINHRIWVEEGAAPSRDRAVPKQYQPAPVHSRQASHDALPSTIETWLLSPVPAPDFSPTGKPALFQQSTRLTTCRRLQRSLSLSLRPAPRSHSADIIPNRRPGQHRQGLPGARRSENRRRRFQAHPSDQRTAAGPGASLSRQRRNLRIRPQQSLAWFGVLSARLLRSSRGIFPTCSSRRPIQRGGSIRPRQRLFEAGEERAKRAPASSKP